MLSYTARRILVTAAVLLFVATFGPLAENWTWMIAGMLTALVGIIAMRRGVGGDSETARASPEGGGS